MRLFALATLMIVQVGLQACQAKPAPARGVGAPLEMAREGKLIATLNRAAIEAKVKPVTLTAYDPYYARTKTYRAFPINLLLEAGFGLPSAELAKQEWILRALDGYAVTMSGERLLETGGHIAFEDVEVPGWEPIGPTHANPGPYYLVWEKDTQRDEESYPRPWQLARLEIAPFETLYPHVAPTGAPEAAQRGFAIFKAQCIRCHMINREGGKVGPELNVPKNVTEYRDLDYLRTFIKNPWAFRYSAMPPMTHLSDAQIDDIFAYFTAMKGLKHNKDEGP